MRFEVDVRDTGARGRWTKRALDRRVRVLGANAPAPTASKQTERRMVTAFFALVLAALAALQGVALVVRRDTSGGYSDALDQ